VIFYLLFFPPLLPNHPSFTENIEQGKSARVILRHSGLLGGGVAALGGPVPAPGTVVAETDDDDEGPEAGGVGGAGGRAGVVVPGVAPGAKVGAEGGGVARMGSISW